jgi:hypothetical protein
VSVHGLTLPWSQSLQSLLEPLLNAHRVGLGSGDIESAMFCHGTYLFMSFYAAIDLQKIRKDVPTMIKLHHFYNQLIHLAMISPYMQGIYNLATVCNNPLELTGDIMNEKSYLETATATKNYMCEQMAYEVKLFLASFFHDYSGGRVYMLKLQELPMCHSVVTRQSIAFHTGLIAAALASQSKNRRKMLRGTRKSLKTMKMYKQSYFKGMHNKVLLLEAELVAITGRIDDAVLKYNSSIEYAQQESLWNEAGLACKRASRSLRLRGRVREAIVYLQQAEVEYTKWGAMCKVHQIQSQISGFDNQ